MKYKNKNQIRRYLLNSNVVLFDTKNHNICFIGNKLEKCSLLVERELFIELVDVCNKLDIQNFII